MCKTGHAVMIFLFFLAPLAAQSISVNHPDGHDWCIGSNYVVTWTSSGVTGSVDVILRPANAPQAPPTLGIAADTSNDGTEGWTVPASVTPGLYLVRVRSINNPTVYGDSAVFQIKNCAAPILTVTSPNGGETWTRGSTHHIIWKVENWTGQVSLSLFKNNVYQGAIASPLDASLGTYEWKEVGKTSKGLADFGHDFRVSVSRIYPGPSMPLHPLADRSDGDFSIAMMKIEQSLGVQAVARLPKTVWLTPALSNVWLRKHGYNNSLGCPLYTTSLAPDPDPTPLMRTGYSNYYNGDVCWEYLCFAYRGIVRFDFSQIKGTITKAELDLVCKSTNSTDGVPYCDGSVLVLDGPGSGFNNPWHHLLDLPAMGGNVSSPILKVSGSDIQITLTDLVKAWISGQQPNYGLSFMGNNENFDDEDYRHCISTFVIGLQVTYIPTD